MATSTGKKKVLSAKEKLAAIERVKNGESKASVARDLGVPESTLRGWCKNEEKIRYLASQCNGSDDEVSLKHSPREKRREDTAPYNLSKRPRNVNSYSPNNRSCSPKANQQATLAELQRLRMQYGLCTPELYSSQPSTSTSANWLQQWSLGQHQFNQQASVPRRTSPSATATTSEFKTSNPSANLLQTVPQSEPENLSTNSSSLDANTMLPFITQSMLNGFMASTPASSTTNQTSLMSSLGSLLALNYYRQQMSMLTGVTLANAATTTASTVTNPMVAACLASTVPTSSSAYSSSSGSADSSPLTTKADSESIKSVPESISSEVSKKNTEVGQTTSDDQSKDILYQQLTKISEDKTALFRNVSSPGVVFSVANSQNNSDADDDDSENLDRSWVSKQRRSAEGRSALDTLLERNNNNVMGDRKVEHITPADGIEHGERFLMYLANTPGLNVTHMQIQAIQAVLKNIKNPKEIRPKCTTTPKSRRK